MFIKGYNLWPALPIVQISFVRGDRVQQFWLQAQDEDVRQGIPLRLRLCADKNSVYDFEELWLFMSVNGVSVFAVS